ncbi:uncharacterized protein LOC113502441 [Trichoplusia ni]|uniref:Uncharacterized protein LOC113502441 n=1 Tax=Trichoplusia ni TaxID=7111 RepID=A0A7E5WHH2_TRINI|nr:uncharacterized protein LOC113502441 [Trichoplusia ni]
MLVPASPLSPLEILVKTIIEQYLATSYCITFVSDVPFNVFLATGLTYLIPSEQNLVEQILNVSEIGCSDYIVRMQEPQKFMVAFERVVHIGDIRRSDRKIIILPYDEDYNENREIDLSSMVFSMKESNFVANMLMIETLNSESDCKLFDLITHKFVGPDEEMHLPIHLDRWDSCREKFEKKANLFPHDITNLNGKTVKVACITYQPFVLLDIDPAIEPLGRDGVEVRMVEEFCRLAQFSGGLNS